MEFNLSPTATRQETIELIRRYYQSGFIWEARELQEAMVDLTTSVKD